MKMKNESQEVEVLKTDDCSFAVYVWNKHKDAGALLGEYPTLADAEKEAQAIRGASNV
jgi:hypothetical protein